MSSSCQQPRSVAPACGRASRVSLYDEVTDRIVRELEAGTVPWVKPWKASGVALGLPRSAATRRNYSGVNVLILWDASINHDFAAQEWLTFRQALSLGGHVRKSERGVTICYADRFIPDAERERARESGDDPASVPFLKRFTVFNISQCEGLPAHVAPAPHSYADADKWPVVKAFVASTGAIIREGWRDAAYYPGEDCIRIITGAAFPSAEEYFSTVFHELAHWTAHPSRLNRDLRHRYGSTAYGREELIAELASAFLCAHFGIVPQIRHADYLGSWLKILKEDSRAIFHAASQASKAADYLLGLRVTSPMQGDLP
jgi:antirestriction protein ArdC